MISDKLKTAFNRALVPEMNCYFFLSAIVFFLPRNCRNNEAWGYTALGPRVALAPLTVLTDL